MSVSRLHATSADGHLAMLAQGFGTPATQVDAMSSDRYQTYSCNEAASAISEGQIATIDIPGASAGSMYDLTKSYILVKGNYTSTNVVNVSSEVAPLHGWTSRVFNRSTVSYGSVNVTEDFNDAGICHYLTNQIDRSHASLHAAEFTEGWIEDDHAAAKKGSAVVGLISNVGAVQRRDHWISGGVAAGSMVRPTTSFKYPPIGPWKQTVLPSDVNVRVRLTRGKDNELCYGTGRAAADMKWSFISIEAYMFRIVLSPTADAALLKHLSTNDWLIKHDRIRMMTQSFEAKTTFMEIRSALQGPKPSKIFLWTAFEDALDGTAYDAATPFRLDNVAVVTEGTCGQVATEVRLRVADQDIPLRGFENIPGGTSGSGSVATGSRDLAQVYEALRALSGNPDDPGITSRNYSNVQLWAFDCSIVNSQTQDPIVESTQIQVSMRLSSANRKRRVLGLISYTDSVITISSDRTITVDA